MRRPQASVHRCAVPTLAAASLMGLVVEGCHTGQAASQPSAPVATAPLPEFVSAQRRDPHQPLVPRVERAVDESMSVGGAIAAVRPVGAPRRWPAF
ncbi:MAG: hypothetical protein JNK72_06560 [Myxococcales bacterium]|nr:hypothetical protein [Myxococcales bacterium]